MKINKMEITIKEISEGFDISKYNGADEDVMCFNGKLNCRPAYQRNFVYNSKPKEEMDKV